jgi:hypothetical protein
VLLNGTPGDYIRHRRGLRQGDPLSPMLFIIVMDVLSSLFKHAEERGLLHDLAIRNVKSRLLIYVDDVVLLSSLQLTILFVSMILDCFGEASGLVVNLRKSCAIPLSCDDQTVQDSCNILQCNPASFPCNYLGLLVSDKKLGRRDLLQWVDKIANRLLGWKAPLLNLAGRAALVRFVLSAIPVYLFIAMNVPKWVISAIDKIRRGFLWKGRKDVKGGHCLVAWDKVTRPLDLGGLGIPNLIYKSWALQAKLVASSMYTTVGNGKNTLFWRDRWLNGCSIAELAPEVISKVDKKVASTRTVHQALEDMLWVRDIKPTLSLVGIQQYLALWETLGEIVLTLQEDHHVWRFESSGLFSSRSCYKVLFLGSITFES